MAVEGTECNKLGVSVISACLVVLPIPTYLTYRPSWVTGFLYFMFACR